MKQDSLDFLKRLLAVPTPSGFEEPGQRVMADRLASYCDNVRTDAHGNLIAQRIPATSPQAMLAASPQVMLAAHMDEIGFMVNHITDEGYIRFVAIGGIDVDLLPGQRVTVHAEREGVSGVVGKKAVHLADKDDEGKKTKIHQLWIDIGAKDKELAGQCVRIGDSITIDAPFRFLSHDGVAASRAFDDKAGCFVIAEAMRLIHERSVDVSVCCVSTIQEEVDLRGARTSAFGLDPQSAIAVDVDHASDYPDAEKARTGDIQLGKGPILYRGGTINPALGDALIRTANDAGIPHQIAACPGLTWTDADVIFLARSGVPTALISIPTRYIHTPTEVVSLNDLESAAKLIAAYLEGITG